MNVRKPVTLAAKAVDSNVVALLHTASPVFSGRVEVAAQFGDNGLYRLKRPSLVDTCREGVMVSVALNSLYSAATKMGLEGRYLSGFRVRSLPTSATPSGQQVFIPVAGLRRRVVSSEVASMDSVMDAWANFLRSVPEASIPDSMTATPVEMKAIRPRTGLLSKSWPTIAVFDDSIHAVLPSPTSLLISNVLRCASVSVSGVLRQSMDGHRDLWYYLPLHRSILGDAMWESLVRLSEKGMESVGSSMLLFTGVARGQSGAGDPLIHDLNEWRREGRGGKNTRFRDPRIYAVGRPTDDTLYLGIQCEGLHEGPDLSGVPLSVLLAALGSQDIIVLKDVVVNNSKSHRVAGIKHEDAVHSPSATSVTDSPASDPSKSPMSADHDTSDSESDPCVPPSSSSMEQESKTCEDTVDVCVTQAVFGRSLQVQKVNRRERYMPALSSIKWRSQKMRVKVESWYGDISDGIVGDLVASKAPKTAPLLGHKRTRLAPAVKPQDTPAREHLKAQATLAAIPEATAVHHAAPAPIKVEHASNDIPSVVMPEASPSFLGQEASAQTPLSSWDDLNTDSFEPSPFPFDDWSRDMDSMKRQRVEAESDTFLPLWPFDSGFEASNKAFGPNDPFFPALSGTEDFEFHSPTPFDHDEPEMDFLPHESMFEDSASMF